MQPLKVLAIAMFVALFVKKLEDEEKSDVEKQVRTLAQDEEWLHPAPSGVEHGVEDTDNARKVKKQKKKIPSIRIDACVPPSHKELARARNVRLKEMQMKSISR